MSIGAGFRYYKGMYRMRAGKGRDYSWPLLLAALLVVAVAVTAIYWSFFRATSPVTTAISRQANFAIFYPGKQTGYTADSKSMSYDTQNKLVTFTAQGPGTNLDFTEQATPTSFVDIPAAYDKLINNLRGYSSFESLHGKVNLTHPKELGGAQAAVMNAKGTLLFIRPNRDLPDDEWRRLFNGLQLSR